MKLSKDRRFTPLFDAGSGMGKGSGLGQEPGGTFVPTDIPDMKMWLDATDCGHIIEGSRIPLWPDLSGNGNSPANGATFSQPILRSGFRNGLNVIEWYLGGSQSLNKVFTAPYAQPNTMLMVANYTKGATGFFYDSAIGVGTDRHAAFVDYAPAPDVFTMYAGSSAPTTPSTPYENDWHLFNMSYNGAGSVLRIDGVQLGTGDCGSQPMGSIGLGCAYIQSVTFLKGFTAEFLLYNKELTAGERSDVEQYLADKWGITIP